MDDFQKKLLAYGLVAAGAALLMKLYPKSTLHFIQDIDEYLEEKKCEGSLQDFVKNIPKKKMQAAKRAARTRMKRKEKVVKAQKGVAICDHGIYECPECAKERKDGRKKSS
jgi:hypothetical protein